MSTRQEIIDNTIDKTQQIVEKILEVELSNQIVSEIEELLDKNYLEESKTYEEQMFNADCWGGGVWDLIYQNHNDYKPVLVLNYEEREDNGCISPVMASFPYKELNEICKESLRKICESSN